MRDNAVELMDRKRTLSPARAALATLAVCLALLQSSFAASDAFKIANPDWFINLTGFGYADIAADVEGGRSAPQYFREYLSGEWAGAIGYRNAPQVEWFEPMFVFPDWPTNSTFMQTTPFSFQDADANGVPDFNADGFNVYTSTIANPLFSVTQTYEFLNAGIGIAQGTHPRSAADPGSFAPSSQYVLRQTYKITNRSAAPIMGVQLYQFLHGLHSTSAVFDDNNYGEPSMCGGVACSAYRYDVTMLGVARAFVDLERPFDDVEGEPPRAIDVTDLFGFVPAIDDAFLRSLLGKDVAAINAAFQAIGVSLDANTVGGIARSDLYVHNRDVIAFHSNDAPIGAAGAVPPFGWETGRYGVRGIDSHEAGKPSTGVHLSVEGARLNGMEAFGPGDKWVGGAQTFALGDLNPGATATFDVLLSVSTVQTITAKPAGAALGAALPVLGSAPQGTLKSWQSDPSRRPKP